MTRPLTDEELREIGARWATPCGSCDYGLAYACTCPTGDPRPVVARLLEEIDRLRQVAS